MIKYFVEKLALTQFKMANPVLCKYNQQLCLTFEKAQKHISAGSPKMSKRTQFKLPIICHTELVEVCSKRNSFRQTQGDKYCKIIGRTDIPVCPSVGQECPTYLEVGGV